MRLSIVLIAVTSLSACAMTYNPPSPRAYRADSVTIEASQAQLMRAARIALVSEGYQIINADDGSGTISTAPKDLRLQPHEANCGTTMGIDYLKDKRTSTTVAAGIVVSDNSLLVRTTVAGTYKPGDVVQDITLSCYSRGSVERRLRDAILAQLDS